MVKIETRLKGEPPLYNPWRQAKAEEAWRFESKTKEGKWPEHGVYGEAEWVIVVAKNNPCFKDKKVEYIYTVVLKDDGENYEEKTYNYIYELEFDENVGIVNDNDGKPIANKRHFWVEDSLKVNKKKASEDKDSNDKQREREREREREQNRQVEIWNSAIRANC